MRTTIFIALLNILALRTQGQEVVRFDTIHQNQVGSFAIGNSVFEIDSGYRVFGIQKGVPGQSQDLYRTDFDAYGGLIQERSIETYQQDYFGQFGTVMRVDSNYYASVGRFGVLGVIDSLFLYKFDFDGDTVWTKFLAADTFFTMQALARTSRDRLLVTGIHAYPEEAYVYGRGPTSASTGCGTRPPASAELGAPRVASGA